MEKRWTNEEVILLKKLKESGSTYKEIQTYFPDRTLKAIEAKSIRLSIKSPNCMPRKDYTGKKFGKWNVIKLSNKKRDKRYLWDCICDCQISKPESEQEHHYITSHDLIYGKTKQCKKCSNKNRTRENRYEEKTDYVIGYTSKNEVFYFDRNDFELIRSYCWYKTSDGYIRTVDPNDRSKKISMHRLIMFGLEQKYTLSNEVDHINGIKYDNRRSNLRNVCHANNMKNRPLSRNNKSRHTGVFYLTKKDRWVSTIIVNGKSIYLGSFKEKEDAIDARTKAEEEYFGDFARNPEYANNKIPKRKKVG